MNHYTPHSEIKFCILLFVSVKIFSYRFDLFWLYACFFLVYTLKYEGLCLIYVICVCLRLVAPNSYCVVSLFCLSSSCVPCFTGLWIVHFWLPLRYSAMFIELYLLSEDVPFRSTWFRSLLFMGFELLNL